MKLNRCISLFCALCLLPLFSPAADMKLKNLSLQELVELETISSNEVDEFDSLFQSRRITLASGGLQQSLQQAPAVSSVITAQDIEAMGATTLGQALQSVPGLYIGATRTNFNSEAYAYVRGNGQNSRLLFMVNGLRVRTLALNTSSALSSQGGIPLRNVARIEVLRGPGSALYGADAMFGVINIITKSAEDIGGTEVGAQIGSYDSREAWALHGAKYNKMDLATSMEYRSTEGHRRTIEADLQTGIDTLNSSNISLAPGPTNTNSEQLKLGLDLKQGNWQLRLSHQIHRLGGGTNSSFLLAPDLNFIEQSYSMFDLSWHNESLVRHWTFDARLSYSRFEWDDIGPRTLMPVGALNQFNFGWQEDLNFVENYPQFEVSSAYGGLSNHYIKINAGIRSEDLSDIKYASNVGIDPATGLPFSGANLVDLTDTSSSFLPELTRKNSWLMIEDNWIITDHWLLVAGVRHDQFNNINNTTTPRASLIWAPNQQSTYRFMYSQGVQSPSVFTQFANRPPTFIGNPKLKPVDIVFLELAMDYRFSGQSHFSANIYQYELNNEVSYIVNSNPTYENSNTWDGHGLELEMRHRANKNNALVGNFSYQASKDDKGETGTNRAPAMQAYLRHDWRVKPHWFLNTQLHWAGDFYRATADNRSDLENQVWANINLRYKIASWRITLAVRNLFDTDMRVPSSAPVAGGQPFPNDFPQEDRNIFLELSYRM